MCYLLLSTALSFATAFSIATFTDSTDKTCDADSISYHNEFVKQEFGRQSNAFYQGAKKQNKKTDNLTPLIDALQIKTSDTILDLACGPGIATTEIAKKNPQKVIGIDITKEMLDIGIKHAVDNGFNINDNKIEFIQGNVENLPFKDNTFDIVTTRWTLHHFAKLTKAINEVHRVLKPKTGKFIFLEFIAPNGTKLEGALNAISTIRDPSHIWTYNETEWIKQINRGGFNMENIEIMKRLNAHINWMEFIERTNPSPNDIRARKSIHVISQFLTNCHCQTGMNFYYKPQIDDDDDDDDDNHNYNDKEKQLMIISNYIIVKAVKN